MRRFTGTESGALIVAALFFVGGIVDVVYPKERVIVHPTVDAGGNLPETYIESANKQQVRWYGILAIAVGVGIASLAIYPSKKQPAPDEDPATRVR
jgi:hypothetical protein